MRLEDVTCRRRATHDVETVDAGTNPTGQILMEEFMRPRASASALAGNLAVPLNRISGIVNGTQATTAETVLRWASTSACLRRLWLDLESNFELRRAADRLATVASSVTTRVA